jgi:hypothetical protein
MSKHTPGPWAVSDPPRRFVLATVNGVRTMIADAELYLGFSGDEKTVSDEQAAANVRLMAVSPEMFDLLLECIPFTRCTCTDLINPPVPCFHCRVGAVLARANRQEVRP